MNFKLFLSSTFLVISGICFGQNTPDQASYHIVRTNEDITIDGILEESIWKEVEEGKGFYMTRPTDSLPATDQTYFRITYDEDNIYFALIAYEGVEGSPIASSLRRDFNFRENDVVAIYLDTYGDRSNGFTFQVTPNNVQREGILTLGGDISNDWDNKWYSASTIEDDKWTVETAIPFKSIRYNSNEEWGIQLIRNVAKRNEMNTWVQVPVGFRPSDLAFSGRLIWDQPPPETGTNISFIPFITAGVNKDFEEQTSRKENFDAGFDAKIGVSNALNLDLTFNPDFSQVEVDRQVTNLSRFEIYFPERRQFFLENQDLFAQNGFPPSRPFFSRRIGIATDDDDEVHQVPILGGARLSGKIGKDWRIGALNMVTAEDRQIGQPMQNYSVAVVQRQLFSRSNLGAVLVNRDAMNFNSSDTSLNSTRYNRVVGLDYNLATFDNRWEGNFYYHRSFDPGDNEHAYAHGAFLQYKTRAFEVAWFHNIVGDHYNAEVGFVPRNGIITHGMSTEYRFYPTTELIQEHGPQFNISRVLTDAFNPLDIESEFRWKFVFRNTSYAEIGNNFNSVTLQDSFDPSRSDGPELTEGKKFSWISYAIFYRSDRRKFINFSSSLNYGNYFNGQRLRVRTTLNMRYQPFVALALTSEYNQVRLPNPYNNNQLYLIGPRLDITFNTKIFFTTFVQYNSQSENLNLNSRLQWRFKPVSDLYIVYTDNYNTIDYSTKNRALVMKLSYWFNL